MLTNAMSGMSGMSGMGGMGGMAALGAMSGMSGAGENKPKDNTCIVNNFSVPIVNGKSTAPECMCPNGSKPKKDNISFGMQNYKCD
jgi:hypothetical protein